MVRGANPHLGPPSRVVPAALACLLCAHTWAQPGELAGDASAAGPMPEAPATMVEPASAADVQPLQQPPQVDESRRLIGFAAEGIGEPAANATAGPAADGSGSLLDLALATAGVLGLFLIAAYLLRGVARTRGGLIAQLGPGGRAPSGVLDVLGRYPVAPGQQLVLLRLGGRVLLLSQSYGRGKQHAGFSTLCEVTEPDEVAELLLACRDDASEQTGASFRRLMDRFNDDQPLATGGGSSPPPAAVPAGGPADDHPEPLSFPPDDGPIEETLSATDALRSRLDRARAAGAYRQELADDADRRLSGRGGAW